MVIALMPTVSFFGYLYYTDLLSLFTLLLSYRFSLSRRYFFSSLVRFSSYLIAYASRVDRVVMLIRTARWDESIV